MPTCGGRPREKHRHSFGQRVSAKRYTRKQIASKPQSLVSRHPLCRRKNRFPSTDFRQGGSRCFWGVSFQPNWDSVIVFYCQFLFCHAVRSTYPYIDQLQLYKSFISECKEISPGR